MARSRNHSCRGKATSVSYYVCVFVALGIQHEISMRRIILSTAACPALPYLFFTLSHKMQDFSENKNIEHKIRSFNFL